MPDVAIDDIDTSIGERFDRVAAAYAGKLAVATPRGSVRYAELKTRADAIARYVVAHFGNVRPGKPPVVVMRLRQGIDAIAAALGILKAGACYVPVDPDESPARLAAVVQRSRATLILVADGTSITHAPEVGARIASIAEAAAAPAAIGGLPGVGPTALAYVYFTSGSTGAPKGVFDTHRNVLHNVRRYTRSLRIVASDRLTLLQPPHFSGAVSSTYAALLNGATALAYDLHVDGPDRLAHWLAETGATIYHSVPAIFRNFVAGRARYPAMRCVRLEGDRALAQDAHAFKAHFARGARLVNGLGATETGLVCQHFVDHDTPIADGALPIGRPVEGIRCFVADANGDPVPEGAVGEIVVESAFLAQGYWHDEAETARRFQGDGERRRYRTGDLGAMRADGCLEFHGRVAADAKVGGRRVDVARIEHALLRVAGVRDAACVVTFPTGGDARVCAAIVTGRGGAPSPGEVRAALGADDRGLDAIPSHYALCDALPLTPFGKIDRAAVAKLAFLPAAASGRGETASPLSGTQRRLARIWSSVLGRAVVACDLSFLDCGGDSLCAMQVLARVCDEFGVRVSPIEFFAAPTIAAQASLLDAATSGPPADRRRRTTPHEA